ncbi:hypothetical protein B0H17DRAFT_1130542 [Mycena rosella]|uniref:Uncharacterized protein n=1 Tax=Mycena rosella TaxID=1033263 RepID=A0AAD7DSS8_MYCRO|nr:hypothetical protein B0H17DRAFT_1130542 [Mycena rosella]
MSKQPMIVYGAAKPSQLSKRKAVLAYLAFVQYLLIEPPTEGAERPFRSVLPWIEAGLYPWTQPPAQHTQIAIRSICDFDAPWIAMDGYGYSSPLLLSSLRSPAGMNGKYLRLTPPPEPVCYQTGQPFAQFEPKTLYLFDGAAPVVLGRASSRRENNRLSEPDNAYLKVPTGQTALGREHAALCLYIAMKERDGMILPADDAMTTYTTLLNPHSEPYRLNNCSRVRLGINGAITVRFLVDVVFELSDTDKWSSTSNKRFIRALPS